MEAKEDNKTLSGEYSPRARGGTQGKAHPPYVQISEGYVMSHVVVYLTTYHHGIRWQRPVRHSHKHYDIVVRLSDTISMTVCCWGMTTTSKYHNRALCTSGPHLFTFTLYFVCHTSIVSNQQRNRGTEFAFLGQGPGPSLTGRVRPGS